MGFEYLDSQIIYSCIEIEYINTSIDIPAGAKRHLSPSKWSGVGELREAAKTGSSISDVGIPFWLPQLVD
jgi:hypothetical protein